MEIRTFFVIALSAASATPTNIVRAIIARIIFACVCVCVVVRDTI